MSSHAKILLATLALPLVAGLFWPGRSCGNNRGTEAKDGEVARSNSAEQVATGVWNGEHVSLEVKQDGASIEFDCAHGSINKRLALDKDGRFSVAGTFTFERGGPVTPQSSGGDRPARYAGRLEGKRMTLTVTLTDNNQTIDTFTLTHDGHYQVTKCL